MAKTSVRIALSALVALMLALTSSYVVAQVNTADLHGTISDPSKAVVADAEITVQTLDTGLFSP
jgi:hypothetical protein